jgi:competence protein ComEC
MTVRATFLDVGQGDCSIFLDEDRGCAIVVDAPGAGRLALEAVLADARVLKPDLVVATHSDSDHVCGVVAMVRKLGAKEVRYNLDRALPSDPEERTRWRSQSRALAGLEDKETLVGPATEGVSGSVGSMNYLILSPSHAMVAMAQAISCPNRASAIVRISAGSCTFLLGGDADSEGWGRLIDHGADIKADVFRVPHHGGAIVQRSGDRSDISWDTLLAAVDARLHVVSVGTDNRHRHPTRDALLALGQRADRARVTCTEVNLICAGSAPLPSPTTLPATAKAGLGGRVGGCRCAGTITVTVDSANWSVSPSRTEHEGIIHALESPMCQSA